MSSVRGKGSSKLNENLPATTEQWEWAMCFKRAHLNSRALLLAHQCPSVIMQYRSLSMQIPLIHLPPVQQRSYGHRSTPEAVICFSVISSLKFGSNSCHFSEMYERNQTVSLTTFYGE